MKQKSKAERKRKKARHDLMPGLFWDDIHLPAQSFFDVALPF